MFYIVHDQGAANAKLFGANIDGIAAIVEDITAEEAGESTTPEVPKHIPEVFTIPMNKSVSDSHQQESDVNDSSRLAQQASNRRWRRHERQTPLLVISGGGVANMPCKQERNNRVSQSAKTKLHHKRITSHSCRYDNRCYIGVASPPYALGPHFLLLLHMMVYFVAAIHMDNKYFHVYMFSMCWAMTMLLPTLELDLWDLLPQQLPKRGGKMRMCGTINSFAFGGRGYFLSRTRGRRKISSIFDSTLGYPGEGPTKRKVVRSNLCL